MNITNNHYAFQSYYKDVKSVLGEMNDNTKNKQSLEMQEKQRYQEFQSTAAKEEHGQQRTDPDRKAADKCDYCPDYCVCGTLRTARYYEDTLGGGGGRKRKRSGSSTSTSGKEKHVRKILSRDEIIQTIYNQEIACMNNIID